jgi:RNA polymerase sporulation-specific sigma factor
LINKVEISGVNTAKLPVLSQEEKKELFIRIKNGDEEARKIFISGNLRLVLSVIQRFRGRGETADDLFQIGCVGLIKAIDNFDLSHEVKFSTYAVPMILGEVKRYLRDNSTLRIARSIKDTAYKALKVKEELTNKLGMDVTLSMVAKEMGIEEYIVASAIDSMKDTISMSEPIYNDGGDTIYLEDQLMDNKGSMYSLETRISLYDALNRIKERERYVLVERYIIGKTQIELSDELGISQAQVSRLEKSGINNIKKLIR